MCIFSIRMIPMLQLLALFSPLIIFCNTTIHPTKKGLYYKKKAKKTSGVEDAKVALLHFNMQSALYA
ncbi:AAA family ATPase [Ktedonobacter racemifer DSM 44963]|uniref:AAA family ATPase n=1 Tax=Ktedonobacter racemifer DSM 44963 TaxID=485913 RepID=D6U3M1_KTERA|nr:AAA family ATPase [Ktedonobacter racemifer DSM 44963]